MCGTVPGLGLLVKLRQPVEAIPQRTGRGVAAARLTVGGSLAGNRLAAGSCCAPRLRTLLPGLSSLFPRPFFGRGGFGRVCRAACKLAASPQALPGAGAQGAVVLYSAILRGAQGVRGKRESPDGAS